MEESTAVCVLTKDVFRCELMGHWVAAVVRIVMSAIGLITGGGGAGRHMTS